MALNFKSKAKVNLFLHVNARLENGYHNLESIFYYPDIYDEITVKKSPEFSINYSGEFATKLPKNYKENIVFKVYKLFKNRFPNKVLGLEIGLQKNLPISSGIGGGSGNAACVINALSTLYELNLSSDELIKISAKIGADVPASLTQEVQCVSGIGEKLRQIKNFPRLNILLINPLKPISTKAIFEQGFESFSEPINLPPNFSQKSLITFLGNTRNDLYSNAVKKCPELEGVISQISAQKGNLLARMSGSGATCFGVFDDSENLKIAAQNLQKTYPQYWVKTASQ